MASPLPVSKGISNSVVTHVPDKWDAAWFRTFIKVHLQNGDVRNATPGGGIVITGNSTKPATISISADSNALLTQPYVLAQAPSGISTAFNAYRLLAPQNGVLTVTDGGAQASITVGVASNGIGNAQLRKSAATSVIGNAFNASGNVADIAASADGQLLRQSGTTLGFGTVKIADTTGLGSSFTTSGLTAGQVLRASGASAANFQTLAFGDLTGSATLSQLPTIANNAVLGNVSGGVAVPAALTTAQLTALVNTFTTALPGAVPASGGGTVNFLRADGIWAAPAYPVAASPSAGVGLVAVNGTAATFMRSDAAPALDQSITPTWTGSHKFNSTVGINGATPPAKVAGFGTPTGTGVIANFPGATATLAQCSQAIAQLITDLKAFGLYGV